ncbi:MAG TPA: ankyrin repeat domain-containing protein [Gammaproteobacteria bacterium]|nr:ankyrin repeat domain-containing protein [Gammaproteobacteria bacterium]
MPGRDWWTTDHYTPLITAVFNEDIEAISFLATQKERLDLEFKLKIESKGLNGKTALEYATSKKQWEVVKKLIELGANPGEAMSRAVSSENLLDIEKLAATQPSPLEAPDREGNTAFMQAIKHKRWAVARKLIELGANINAENNAGETPFSLAAFGEFDRGGYAEGLSILRAAQNQTLDLGLLEASNREGDTALILAIKNQKWEVARHLVELGANINAENNAGETSFSIAAFNGYAEGLSILRAAQNENQTLDLEWLETLNADGDTALMLAIKHQRWAVASHLVELGANINAKNKAGETILGVAALEGYTEGLSILMSDQNQPVHLELLEAPNADGDTALMLAIKHQRWAVASHLIELGANIHAKNNGGATPMTLAVSRGDKKGISVLKGSRKTEVKLDVEAPNAEGDTALMLAIRRKEWQEVINLVEYGANKGAKNKKGETPMILFSREIANAEISKILKSCGITAQDIKTAKALDPKRPTVEVLQTRQAATTKATSVPVASVMPKSSSTRENKIEVEKKPSRPPAPKPTRAASPSPRGVLPTVVSKVAPAAVARPPIPVLNRAKKPEESTGSRLQKPSPVAPKDKPGFRK